MKPVYFLTNALKLYSDVGVFFSTLQNSKNFTDQELIRSIPRGNITVYFDRESAERALREKRNMALVTRDDEGKGFTYRSKTTPLILEVQLKDEMEPKSDEVSRTIRKELIDFTKPAKVINCEKEYEGQMPSSLNIDATRLDETICILQ